MFGRAGRPGEDIHPRENGNMRTVVYLCRHAAYENPQDIFHGRLSGFPLSEEGRRDARRLARELSARPIVAVYSSPLTRAYQTAQIIAAEHNLPVSVDPRLIDIKTPLEGAPRQYIDSIDGNFYTPDLIAAGGEQLREIVSRMHECITEKASQHKGRELVVVSHGDPIMCLRVKYLGKRRLSHRTIRVNYVPQAGGLEIAFDESDNVTYLNPIPGF